MNYEKKYNNYTISHKNEKSLNTIKAYLIDIKNRDLVKVVLPSTAESFIQSNNFYEYKIVEIKTTLKNIRKQIAIFSIDEDLKKNCNPFKFNEIEIFSNCLICSCLKYNKEIRNVQLSKNDIMQMIKL